MDVVAHAGAVGCGVVVAIDAQGFTLARRHLCDVGGKVVRHVLRVFADQAAFVRAHRVEVAQPRDAPLARLGLVEVCEHALDHELAPAVRVGRRKGEVLAQRLHGRFGVHRGRGRKHQRAHARGLHGLQQRKAACDIVVVVAQRLAHRLAHGLEAGEVDHCADRVLGKQALQQRGIAHIALDDCRRCARDAREALWHRAAAVAEVVEDEKRHAGLGQRHAGVRANEAGAAGDEDHKSPFWIEMSSDDCRAWQLLWRKGKCQSYKF